MATMLVEGDDGANKLRRPTNEMAKTASDDDNDEGMIKMTMCVADMLLRGVNCCCPIRVTPGI